MTKKLLQSMLVNNEQLYHVIQHAAELDLPQWYVGAGAICQTVWNQHHGFDPAYGIKDIDLVYFDSDNQTAQQERDIQKRVHQQFGSLALPIEVTNEARVHQWYFEEFGIRIDPYDSTVAAIATWPTTASAIGVKTNGSQLDVFAPFGLDDLLGMIVRPNRRLVTESVYYQKAERWKATWPDLTIVPW
ncbi:MAG: nucleotidyltransferase family protein [Planctomycetota bacterium]